MIVDRKEILGRGLKEKGDVLAYVEPILNTPVEVYHRGELIATYTKHDLRSIVRLKEKLGRDYRMNIEARGNITDIDGLKEKNLTAKVTLEVYDFYEDSIPFRLVVHYREYKLLKKTDSLEPESFLDEDPDREEIYLIIPEELIEDIIGGDTYILKTKHTIRVF